MTFIISVKDLSVCLSVNFLICLSVCLSVFFNICVYVFNLINVWN